MCFDVIYATYEKVNVVRRRVGVPEAGWEAGKFLDMSIGLLGLLYRFRATYMPLAIYESGQRLLVIRFGGRRSLMWCKI